MEFENKSEVSDDCMENFLSCIEFSALSVGWSQCYLSDTDVIGQDLFAIPGSHLTINYIQQDMNHPV